MGRREEIACRRERDARGHTGGAEGVDETSSRDVEGSDDRIE